MRADCSGHRRPQRSRLRPANTTAPRPRPASGEMGSRSCPLGREGANPSCSGATKWRIGSARQRLRDLLEHQLGGGGCSPRVERRVDLGRRSSDSHQYLMRLRPDDRRRRRRALVSLQKAARFPRRSGAVGEHFIARADLAPNSATCGQGARSPTFGRTSAPSKFAKG